MSERDKRMARIILKTLKAASSSDNSENEEAAKQFTASPFEQRLIGLASYWSNDLIELCQNTLEIKKPEGVHAFNADTHEAWYKWWCETIDALPVDPV